MRAMSEPQRRCMIEATIEPLIPFRRGFARSKSGPFHDARTVNALVSTGTLRVIRDIRGKRYMRVTARAE